MGGGGVGGGFGSVQLDGPCNDVHVMLLVIDTSRRSDVCLYIYIFIYVCVTFLIAQYKACLHLSGCML